MKTGRPSPFWSLSPTAAARAFERSCWLAAAAIVLALALGAPAAAGGPTRLAAGLRPEDPNVLVYQRKCIDRIIGQSAGQGEDAIFQQVNRQCLVPRRGQSSSPAGLRLVACERPFPEQVRPVVKRVAGCPSR